MLVSDAEKWRNQTAKSKDFILSPKWCIIVPAKIQPTPKRKEQEHNVCAVVVVPNHGIARIATSKAMEIPAWKTRLNGTLTTLIYDLPG